MKRSDRVCWVYMTARDRKQAIAIGRALIREKLAACVNVLGAVTSLYEWGGNLCQEREVAFIAKTARSRVPSLTGRVAELHSYQVPCVVVLPVEGGHPAFLAWVRKASRAVRPTSRSAKGSTPTAAQQ